MGSPFASLYTETVDLPFDPGQTAAIQKLTGRDVERAQAAAAAEMFRGRGFAAKVERLKRAAVAGANVDAEIADPLDGFDRTVLVKAGLKRWSYLEADGKTPKKVTAEAIDDLDDDAMTFFARAILKLTKPGLFQTAEDAKADQKNG